MRRFWLVLVVCVACVSCAVPTSRRVQRPTSFDGQPVPNQVCAAYDDLSSPAAFEDSVQGYLTCAESAWTPILQAIGKQAPHPTLLFEGDDRSVCADDVDDDTIGLYCLDDRTIVLADDLFDQAQDDDLVAPWAVFHEYGHAVQDVVEPAIMQNDSISSIRRMELQATCWSTMQLRTLDGFALDDELRDSIGDDAEVGDDEHGTAAHQRLWAMHGLDSRMIGDCDTVEAARSEVN